MAEMDDRQALQALRERGADEAAVEAVAASGLPPAQALYAIEAGGWLSRLRRLLWSRAPWNAEERARLATIVGLIAGVKDMESDPARFWSGAMPWLGDRSPAEVLARRNGPAAVEELINRIRYGIYP